MAWTTPLTAVTNAALTAAQWNASVRDNLLETAPAKATSSGRYFATSGANVIGERIPSANSVNTAETTSTTTYTNLTTTGPQVPGITHGPACLLAWGAQFFNTSTGSRTLSSVAISGSTTQASDDSRILGSDAVDANSRMISASRVHLQTGMTPGSSTFTQQYRVAAGTGSWNTRHLAVLPF